ncbi:hypothetical protein [Streptomyces sp. NBC_00154]|uniref:hypothetical protein n=1 Tax=Streptomyces sp. NBC_00154 TaxID=2975670 RepID=UPI00224DAFFC|nr:hypothetical protein [Streptomyces sp. NBC_00154]MCX5316821.1 hypothetical protein [Streptomyces sp. NBC_00154]
MRHNRRARILLLCRAVIHFAAFSWHGTETIRPPHCHVSVFTDAHGQPLPDNNGKKWTWHERAYQKEVDAGRGEPPMARWLQ